MTNYLYHHGILGQRWGVRRYQNKDGSLTSAGKARYNDDGSKKNAKDMSDEDLARSNRRLSAEAQYNSLSGKGYKNNNLTSDTLIKAGMSAVGSFLVVGGGMLLKDAIANGSVNKGSLKKASMAGIFAASVASISSATTSMGGQITKDGGKK